MNPALPALAPSMRARANAPLVPTGWQTIGPFFPRTFFHEGDNDLRRIAPEAPPTARGEPIRIVGRVLEEGGKPCVNAILEAWQADASGRFRHPPTTRRRISPTPTSSAGAAPGRMPRAATSSAPSCPAPTATLWRGRARRT